MLFRLSKLEANLSSDIVGIKTDIAGIKTEMSELKADVKSIKSNHLPHIEAAIKELAKGTPNEEHVKAILDLSHEPDIR
jgi:archaellum component FlaC